MFMTSSYREGGRGSHSPRAALLRGRQKREKGKRKKKKKKEKRGKEKKGKKREKENMEEACNVQ